MDMFEELGLHRYIHAQDTFTTYGASCMPAASLRAMREIASSCVELAEVQAKTGDAGVRAAHEFATFLHGVDRRASGGCARQGDRSRKGERKERREGSGHGASVVREIRGRRGSAAQWG